MLLKGHDVAIVTAKWPPICRDCSPSLIGKKRQTNSLMEAVEQSWSAPTEAVHHQDHKEP
jgi:hypothetical protein